MSDEKLTKEDLTKRKELMKNLSNFLVDWVTSVSVDYDAALERLERFQDELAALKVEKRKKSKWHPASEMLPEKYEKVFILFRGDKPEVDWIDATGDWYFNNAPDVTHWMPLPKLPEVK